MNGTSSILLAVIAALYALPVNACLKVHHSLRAEVHQFKTYF